MTVVSSNRNDFFQIWISISKKGRRARGSLKKGCRDLKFKFCQPAKDVSVIVVVTKNCGLGALVTNMSEWLSVPSSMMSRWWIRVWFLKHGWAWRGWRSTRPTTNWKTCLKKKWSVCWQVSALCRRSVLVRSEGFTRAGMKKKFVYPLSGVCPPSEPPSGFKFR